MLKKLRVSQEGQQNLVVVSSKPDRSTPIRRIEMIDSAGNEVSLITPLDSLLTTGKNALIIKQIGLRNTAIYTQNGNGNQVYIRQSSGKEK